jgi:hypothetical protein
VLGSGDDLTLAGLELQRFDVVLGSTVRLKLSGTAATLSTRTAGFERSLKPTVLEYAGPAQDRGPVLGGGPAALGVVQWLQRLAGADA